MITEVPPALFTLKGKRECVRHAGVVRRPSAMSSSSASLPVPKSFGLTYDPPSITLVYALDEKLREREPLGLPTSSAAHALFSVQASARCPCERCTRAPMPMSSHGVSPGHTRPCWGRKLYRTSRHAV